MISENNGRENRLSPAEEWVEESVAIMQTHALAPVQSLK